MEITPTAPRLSFPLQSSISQASVSCFCVSAVLLFATRRRTPFIDALLGELLSVRTILGFVAHRECATHIKPQITFICGARVYAPQIDVMTVVHPSACTTDSVCGARRFGVPRIGCVTDIKNDAP
jgi:hypothetical protein